MYDPPGVAKIDAIDELEHQQPYLLLGDRILVLGEIFLEVVICVFKHKMQLLLAGRVDDVHEAG